MLQGKWLCKSYILHAFARLIFAIRTQVSDAYKVLWNHWRRDREQSSSRRKLDLTGATVNVNVLTHQPQPSDCTNDSGAGFCQDGDTKHRTFPPRLKKLKKKKHTKLLLLNDEFERVKKKKIFTSLCKRSMFQ